MFAALFGAGGAIGAIPPPVVPPPTPAAGVPPVAPPPSTGDPENPEEEEDEDDRCDPNAEPTSDSIECSDNNCAGSNGRCTTGEQNGCRCREEVATAQVFPYW
jgi:hypothetical protein